MSSFTINIAVFPSQDVIEKAIELSENLQKFGTIFTLQKDTVYPHVTLYRLQIKNSDLDKVKERLSEIAANFQPLELRVSQYHLAEGFIDVDYVRTPMIEDLQMRIIEAINPLRDGIRDMDKIRLQTATGKVKESLEKYGYRSVGELFRPHISFTLFTEEPKIDVESLPDPHTFNSKFDTLGLSEQGKHGTSIHKIAVYSLGGKIA